MNTPNPVYDITFWLQLQKEYLTCNSYTFCDTSTVFEELWANDRHFVRDCRNLANKFALSFGHKCDFRSACYLFSEVSYPSLFQHYYEKIDPMGEATLLTRRLIRIDFLEWIIAGLRDGTISPGQSEI